MHRAVRLRTQSRMRAPLLLYNGGKQGKAQRALIFATGSHRRGRQLCRKDSIPYLTIDPAIEEQIRADREAGRMSPYRFRDEDVARRGQPHDTATIARPAFARHREDCEHARLQPIRGQDAGVLRRERRHMSTRPARAAGKPRRTGIGRLLGLNCDLIEAIALGHDLRVETPFPGAGERFLSRCYHERNRWLLQP